MKMKNAVTSAMESKRFTGGQLNGHPKHHHFSDGSVGPDA